SEPTRHLRISPHPLFYHYKYGNRDPEMYRGLVYVYKRQIKVRKEESFGKFMNKTANNHADFARAQREAIIKKVTEVLRPKYGHMYGYDASMPANIEMAIRLVGSYY
ncbi:hypothetical protein ACX3V1_07070, partial [Escherichia coli]